MSGYGFGIGQFTDPHAGQSMTVRKGTHPAEMERLWASGHRDRGPSFGIGIPGPSFGIGTQGQSIMMGGGFMTGPPELVFMEKSAPGSGVMNHCYHCGKITPHCQEWDGSWKCRVIHKHGSQASGGSGSSSGAKECPCGNQCVNTEASHMASCTHPRGDWERIHHCHDSKCGTNTLHRFSDGKWKCSNSH